MPQDIRFFDRLDTIKSNGDLYYLPNTAPLPPLTTLLQVGEDADDLIDDVAAPNAEPDTGLSV